MLRPFGWQAVVTVWQFAPIVTAAVVVLAALYLWGVLRVARRHPARPWPAVADRDVPRRAGRRRAGHRERHRRLRRRAVLGPHGAAPDADHGRAAAADRRPADHAAAAREQEPAAHLGQAGRPVPGGQLPDLAGVRRRGLRGRGHGRAPDGLANLVETNQTLHDAEHVAFLVVGYLFFLPILGSEPIRWRLSPTRSGSSSWSWSCRWTRSPAWCSATARRARPGCATGPRPAWAPGPVQDLHSGGAVMWVGGDAIMFGLMMLVFLMWSMDERAVASGRGWLEAARRASLASLVASHPAPGPAGSAGGRAPPRGPGRPGRGRPGRPSTGTSAAESTTTSTSPPTTPFWPG